MSTERLRDALNEGPDAPGCAEAERIWRAARGELPEPESQALLDHAAACGSCALAWRLAREAQVEAGETPARVIHVSRWRRPLLATAAAAAALAATVLLVPRPAGDSWRGDGAASVRSALPDAPLSRTHFILRWTPAAPGARYDVKVATPDLRLLHEASGLEEPQLLVPEAALASVPRGGTVLFLVTAHLAGDKPAAATALQARVE